LIKRLEHVGLSVRSIEGSLAFYRDLLGMRVVEEAKFAGDLYERILGLTGARGRVVVVQTDSVRLELFEFANPRPKQSEQERPVCDHGITHFCIEVFDIEGEYQRLKAAGVRFHCPPIDFGTAMATYGRDPDGNVFELLQMQS
jgi:catechol 2,3-dioxygenase-like lactoylglutathione lyase family enzyme